MSSNLIFGRSLPSIPKHQLFNREIIKTEEELREITSHYDEPVLALRVFDLETASYCGYYFITQSDALKIVTAELNTNMMLRKQVHDLTQELNEIKQMGMFEFANKYCSDESIKEAGHQLARDLLGK